MDQRLSANAGSEVERLLEHLAGDGHCPLCGAAYLPDGIRIIRGQESRWILSVQCHCCGTGSMITAAVPSHFFSSCSLLSLTLSNSELTPEELQLLGNLEPVSADDVLDMHVYLCQFQGDLASLDLGLQPSGLE